MKSKLFFMAVIIAVFTSLLVSAASKDSTQTPQQVLKQGDVERFIKTFPELKKDFKNLGVKYDAKSGNLSYPSALQASQEYMAILKKHGWDENYFMKAACICLGYSIIEYGKQMQNVDPQLEKSLKELESNPNLSADFKKQLKDQLLAAKGILSQQGQALSQSVHPNDLQMIKPFLNQLKVALEK